MKVLVLLDIPSNMGRKVNTMTVPAGTNTASLLGNGVTVSFPTGLKIYETSHCKVYLDGVLQTTGYSVSDLDTESATVVFDTAPAGGVVIIVKRIVPYEQETEFEEDDGNPSDVTERQFDLCVMQSQQLADITSRALVVPIGDTATSLEVPSISSRVGKVWYWDADGNPSTTTDTSDISAAAAAASASLASAAQTAAELAQDAAEAAAAGIKWKPSVIAATTINISLSGAQTVDGVSCVAGDRVLVKDQSLPKDNGVYIVASGAWTRATDADTWDDLVSQAVSVSQGSTLADTQWVCTSDAGGTLGVTSVTWASFLTSPRDNSVTTAKILDGNVTFSKLATSSVATQSDLESQTAEKLTTAALLKYHPLMPKAWCLFNGTGTPAMTTQSGFSTSITDNGVGDYTLTLSTSMSSTSYAVIGTIGDSTDGTDAVVKIHSRTASTIRIRTTSNGSPADHSAISLVVFGDL